jgi:hypothetical protein
VTAATRVCHWRNCQNYNQHHYYHCCQILHDTISHTTPRLAARTQLLCLPCRRTGHAFTPSDSTLIYERTDLAGSTTGVHNGPFHRNNHGTHIRDSTAVHNKNTHRHRPGRRNRMQAGGNRTQAGHNRRQAVVHNTHTPGRRRRHRGALLQPLQPPPLLPQPTPGRTPDDPTSSPVAGRRVLVQREEARQSERSFSCYPPYTAAHAYYSISRRIPSKSYKGWKTSLSCHGAFPCPLLPFHSM